jgi:hypothetical protein
MGEDAERFHERKMLEEYEAATGHKVDETDSVGNGVCKEYDEAGEGAGIGREGEPVCAACGFDKSEHVVPGADDGTTFGDRVQMAGLAALIRPENMAMPFIIDQREHTLPDGRVMVRYRFAFINQNAVVLANPGKDGAMVPATISFDNDTGRRSLAVRRPRPGDIRLIGKNGSGNFPG